MTKPKFYKTTTGRILPATPILHKMADKMKLVPAEAPKAAPKAATKATPAADAKPAATRGRPKKKAEG